MTKREQRYECERQIMKLKAKLAQSDYKAIKFAEGEISAEGYAETREKRRAWREEINKLQAELRSKKDGGLK